MLIDGHVHIYPAFALERFLDSAWSNLRAADPSQPVGALMLADVNGQDFFRFAPTWRSARWRIEPTDEPISLLAIRDGQPRLALIAGRQIVTRDRLEVLALASDARVRGGMGTMQTLQAVRDAGAIPVLPWGLGKWRSARGAIVADLLRRSSPDAFFIGDNAGRLRWSGVPRLFADALNRGFRILPGSDPLPFAAECDMAGSYGFALDAPVRLSTPAADIASALARTDGPLATFGKLKSTVHIARLQLAMRARRALA